MTIDDNLYKRLTALENAILGNLDGKKGLLSRLARLESQVTFLIALNLATFAACIGFALKA